MADLYDNLPAWDQVLDWIVLAIIIAAAISLLTLVVVAARYRRSVRRRQREGRARQESDFLWVFLVPALNEEVTIADSVSRLRATAATHAVFLVIDDGSDDATGSILARIDDPRLRVLTRIAPAARVGKAAALNAAYKHLRTDILAEPELADWRDEDVIVAVVDADGRLDPRAPAAISGDFTDPQVGGAQVLVEIYNRRTPLTWAQDVEFSSFGRVFQAGRSWWGTANMGGNGQFTRLSALRAVDDGDGPWRDRLTEDQDLGVRMIQAGWRGVQNNDTRVRQQGLNSLRRLYRQRVRWAQGNWQSLSLLRGIGRPRLAFFGRLDAVFYLLTPALQLLTGLAFLAAIVLWAFGIAPYESSVWWVIAAFAVLAFGPGLITMLLRAERWYTVPLAIVLVIPYTVYAWVIFPVLAVALVRQLAGRRSWAKTARESITAQADAPT
ncbi:glycosyltransferase [Microbacterium protaetiae]|uniref:Glycosyltransferase n=1 Tax=Microbacterium protaetiae TaxID=2509458 RepID=A0A4P6EL56_9MICO|nr:glycosyltransferase [Microbacterium protaetiae]QAY60927.1 glycosyltransferase [Microbacterium protaetiae]